MSDWLSYTLSDFLLFSPETYYRLLELHNEALWPAQLLALALGGVLFVLLLNGRGRAAALILAGFWLWVAWAYLLQRYETINWAARYAAFAFALEALLIAAFALTGRTAGRGRDAAARAGLGLLAFALLAQPLIGPALGRPWTQVEVFGLAPDPTVAGAIGALFVLTRRAPWLLLAIPLLWCALTGATLWAMGSPEAPLMPSIGMLAIALAAYRHIATDRAKPA